MFEVRYVAESSPHLVEEYDDLSKLVSELSWLFEHGVSEVKIVRRW